MTDDSLTQELAGRTAQLVEALGVSERALCKRLGVSPAFVNAVTRGRSLPSLKMARELHKIYGVSLDWYLLGEGEMFETTAKASAAPPQRDEVLDLVREAIARGFRERLHGFLEAVLSDGQYQERRRAQAS